jgi:Fic family protein
MITFNSERVIKGSSLRKSELHPELRSTCVPVPGHSGCFAVVPPLLHFRLHAEPTLFPLAEREVQALADAVEAAPQHAGLLMHMLNRREAVDSSQIEGTHTEFDELLLHELDADTPEAVEDDDAEQTLNYVSAYSYGVRKVQARSGGGRQALNPALILELHRLLMKGDAKASPGRFRNVQNYIGGFKMEQARFIPPPPNLVPALMADLDRALRYEADPDSHYELGVLSRAPQVHAQFEAIHPFVDGNGRVGRLLFPLMFLADAGIPIHLATFLKARQQDYYDALLQVQMKLAWSAWITLFLECTIASCRHTMQLLNALRSVADRWHAQLRERRTRKDAAVWRLTDMLLGQPVVTVNAVASRLGVSFPTANAAVGELVDLKVLRLKAGRRRDRAFHAQEVIKLLYAGVDAVLEDVDALRNYRMPTARSQR